MLISKKDLLIETKISYGQLYRWKREALIPESWFIKQPSFTGQETFFPKTKILERIKAIQQLKDKYSLEELSRILSPEISERIFTSEDLEIIEEIDKGHIPCFCRIFGKTVFSYIEILIFIAISSCKRDYSLQLYDIEQLCYGIKDNIAGIKQTDFIFVLLDKNKEYFIVLFAESAQILFDKRLNKLFQINLNDISSNMKIKYRKSFNFKFDNEKNSSPFDASEGKEVMA